MIRPLRFLTILCALLHNCLLVAATPDQGFKTPLQPASFADLKGWDDQQVQAIKPVLEASCKKRSSKTAAHSPLSSGGYQNWQTICQQLSHTNNSNLREFFEKRFNVYRVTSKSKGLFTGYYSPIYEGRLKKEPGFDVPLLKYPTAQGQQWVQASDSRQLIQQKINAGKIKTNQVLAWIKSPVDAFFLQIQGSGSIRLKNGQVLHAAYGGNNKHPYVAIGKVLKQQGELKSVSMQTIRDWLASHPEKQQALFNKNPRYIFFRKSNVGAITAQGVTATAQRTMAVDPRYIPYGTLLWVDTELTYTKTPYRQLMVAQDTGTAIKGPVRGDIYMGAGADAAALAGPQQAEGTLYILIPK
ncbi:MAG: MltA domain-containing protein [Endozoicomonas sp. (ex Botrylloides leachii)]|nr:MltA domain-containing protein [Endozoicomonas sp. (ex Botrylloides leachii)]